MPDKPDVSNYTGVFRLASPGDPHRKVIKRNRQVVSCVPCRNRKLKCDRQQPCASCVRRNDARSCRFFGGPGSGGGEGFCPGLHASSSPVQKREVQARLQMLESLVSGLVTQEQQQQQQPERNGPDAAAAATPGGPARSVGSPAVSHEGSARSTMSQTSAGGGGHLSREGNEIRFVGATNYAAVLECIRDLQGFVDANTAESPAARTSPPRQQGQQRGTDQFYGSEAPVTIQEVIESLPPRAECDSTLTFFFQQIYMIPVLLHTGQFQRAYEKFWEDPSSTSLLWISILFTLLSTSTFQQASKALGSGSSTIAPEVKEKIAGFSSMAYRCLLAGDYLQSKPYCVEATLLFGMHLGLQKRDAEPLCWHSIGTAVRLAQRMGYHRDASHLSRGGYGPGISPFEAEMRRRTWHTLEYFDVACSFQLGVPPIIQGDDVDTQLPSNLRDDEFSEDTSVLPQGRPTLDFTPILGSIYYSRQVKLLRRVVQQALAVTQPPYGDVRRLDADLRALHEDVPPSLRYRPIRESGLADVPDVIIRRIACEILHLKCLCVLHRRYLTFERDNGMYDGSREACREASLRLLDIQAEFDDQSREGARLFEKRHMLTNYTGYHDFLLAAMCICLDLTAGSRNSNRQDHERRMGALRRARAIWGKTADRSKEAAHAAGVLEHILSRVSQTGQDASSATRSPRADDGERAATAASGPSGRDGTNTGVSSQVGNRDVSLPVPNWSAINNRAPPKPKAPTKSYSMEWSYAWLDNPGKQKPGDQAPDDVPDDPLESALGRGIVDWDRIDSFLLDREDTYTAGLSAPPAPQAEDSSTNARASREGWPYMQYKEPEEREAGTNFRTWARTGISLAGFGPSSSGSSSI